MLAARESPPELSWFAARSLATALLKEGVEEREPKLVGGVESKDFLELASLLPMHLRSLVLHFLIRTGSRQEGELLCLTDKMLGRMCRGILNLDFSRADYLGGISCFEHLRNYCPGLTSLNMSHWKRSDALTEMASGHENLREINLSRCTSLDDEHIRNITRHSPMLEKIDLSHNELLTDEALFALATNCPLLHSINLNCCYQMTDVGLASLLMSMEATSAEAERVASSSGCYSRLKELGIKRLTRIEKALSILLVPEEYGSNWPHIQKLNAKSLSCVAAETWTQLLGPCLSQAIELKLGETSIDWCAIVEKHETMKGPLNDVDASDLQLQSLDLSWNDEVDEDCVCRVLQRSPRLEVLKLRACETIGAKTLHVAAQSCPGLIKINMSRCNHVSNAAVMALARNCRELKYANLAWSDCTSSGMLSLLNYCQDLKILNVSGCKTITVNDIEDSVVEHASLTFLDCSWVNAMSEGVASTLVSKRKVLKPNLQLEVVDYYNETARFCSLSH